MSDRPCETIAATAGIGADPAYRSLVPPVWTSDTYCWPDSDTKPDYDYSRTVNPNRDLLSAALAEMEGAAGGVVTGSGQSAALLALLLLDAGSLVVAPHDGYGGTYRLLKGLEEQKRLKVRFVDQNDDEAFAAAMALGPALLWIETPSNPCLRLVDIAQRAGQAREAGALVLADNTLMTPCRQRPLPLGCDLVLHSTTKAINGHADLFGGALLAREPDLVERICWWANAAGLSASAADSALTLRGLRTLPIRVDRQEETAREVAAWLGTLPQVSELFYPGLRAFPQRALVERQQSGPGAMISFRLRGGEAAAAAFLKGLRTISLASSLGGFATLVCKPATMTHRGMPPEAQAAAGIEPDLLRLSIGLEAPGDLIADLGAGFAALKA